jgi:hypothetical protein
MADIKGKILVENGAGGKDLFNTQTTAEQVIFKDDETLEQKFKKWIPKHSILADRAGVADRSDLSEDTRKFMGHPVEDFLLRDELLTTLTKAAETNCWKQSVSTVQDLFTTYPDAVLGDIAAVNGGDTAGSIYRFNGTDWEILVKNGKSVLPNAVVDKINQSIVLQKIEFGSNKWTKNATDDYQLVLEVPNAEVLKVIIYDGQVKKTSTITAEYTDTQILLRSVYPERGYVLYFNSNTSNVIEYGDTV